MGNLNTNQILENTDGAINKEQSRKIGNIWHNAKMMMEERKKIYVN
jgi:hypothetical protein